MSDSASSGNATKTVLVIDDEGAVLAALVRVIQKFQMRVLSASNGTLAQQILAHEKVDLVISDIRMPEMDGIALTRAIRSKRPDLPVILMTAFSEILETQEAFSVGADEFLVKPFDREELSDAILRCINRKAQDHSEDNEYCRLAIEDFTSGKQINFNIYVRLSERKYVKVAHQGEDISVDRIRAYRTKDLQYLYLRKNDFKKYVDFSLSLTGAASTSDKISKPKKLNLIKHTGEVLLEQIRHDGIDNEAFDHAVSFVESTVTVLSDSRDILGVLELLKSHGEHLYAHAVGVSLYSVMLARAIGWTLPSNLFKVAVGGLLHDLGEKEMPQDLLKKPRIQWTSEEIRHHETHPSRGAELLAALKYVPSDVVQIIQQHHENCQGLGFPAKTRSKAIHPMAKLVSVVDEFCERIIKSPSVPGMSPVEAAEQMHVMCSDRLDPEYFAALCRLCHFTPPPRRISSKSRRI